MITNAEPAAGDHALLRNLAERSDLIESVIAASRDCIMIMDPDGTIRFVNQCGCKNLGVPKASMILGESWPTLWPKASQGLIVSAVERAARGANVRFDAFCPTARGKDAYWEVSIAPVRDRTGTIIQLVVKSRDITARIELEQVVRDREAELETLGVRIGQR